jgi:hypothetical protein
MSPRSSYQAGALRYYRRGYRNIYETRGGSIFDLYHWRLVCWCMHVCMRVVYQSRARVFMYVCVCICMYVCVCVCVCVCWVYVMCDVLHGVCMCACMCIKQPRPGPGTCVQCQYCIIQQVLQQQLQNNLPLPYQGGLLISARPS